MSQFRTVARIGDISEGEGRAFTVSGRVIAVFNDAGVYYAIDDRCPHAGSPLSYGTLVDGMVVCAWHGWRFQLCDGAWADYPKMKTNVYPVRVVGDEIQVEVPDHAPPSETKTSG